MSIGSDATSEEAKPKLHACTMPRGARMTGNWAEAIEYCWQDEQGHFYVSNDEYASFVNFCPFCGAKAPKGIPLKAP